MLSELSPGLLAAVGGTPLVSLPELGGGTARVWAKLESFNPGGSAKDRTARALVADARWRPQCQAGARLELGAQPSGGVLERGAPLGCGARSEPLGRARDGQHGYDAAV